MPYADDMDSADEHLSPSDGYFASSSSASRVPPVMVQDPDVERRRADDAAAKEREATAANVPLASPSTSTIPRSTLIQARPPSVYSDAPPAYSPSASISLLSPTSNHRDHHHDNDNDSYRSSHTTAPRTYNTFAPAMGSPRHPEQDPLLSRSYQSMGDRPADEETGFLSPWKKRRDSIRSRLPAWLTRKVIIGGAILFVIILVLGVSSTSSSQNKESTLKPSRPIATTPGAPGDDLHSPGNSPIFDPVYCKDAKFRFDDLSLPLNARSGKDVAFIEDLYDGEGRTSVSVSGAVVIRRAKDGQAPVMHMQMVTDYEDLRLKVVVDNSAQLMKISVPRRTHSDFPPRLPCLEIRTTIWVPADASLGELGVDVISLGIYTLDDLSLKLTNAMKLSSISGDIGSGLSSMDASLKMPTGYSTPPSTYKLDSRIVRVGTTSGRIGGHYPLYDILDLHTTSGSIDASITPHEVLDSAPKPATLTIHTKSGSIHAEMPIRLTSSVPDRDYVTDIRGVSGSVRGNLVQGSHTYVQTTSGSQELTLLPVLDLGSRSPSNPATLETIIVSSHLTVEILDPVWFGNANTIPARETTPSPYFPIGDHSPLDAVLPPSAIGPFSRSSSTQVLNLLKATHKTTSGSITLRYPEAWEGDLHASTISGSIKITGKDVHKIGGHDGWVGSDITVRKGPSDKASNTEVETTSSSIQVALGPL